MHISNLGNWYADQYDNAMLKYVDPDHLQDALIELQDLLKDPALPGMYRFLCNLALADGTEDWYLAESLIKDAEVGWHDMMDKTLSAEEDFDGAHKARKERLEELRGTLDSLKWSQVLDDPKNPKRWAEAEAAELRKQGGVAGDNADGKEIKKQVEEA
ncbi:hypothetical protein LTR95_014428 [Oleoguttula sp. CCFEE 5521]